MKKNQKLKKGFTLVELVIVIAVIAILAAVLIPTFGSIIRKAHETKALQEVTNAYKATLADDILNGTTIVHGHQYDIKVKYSKYNKPIYIVISTDGKASISKESIKEEDLTHSLTTDGKLKSYSGTSVRSVEFTLKEKEQTLQIGNKLTLGITIRPIDATNKNVTWSSSNNAVATVTQNGVVTAVDEGQTTITVTTEDGNHTATLIITVYNHTHYFKCEKIDNDDTYHNKTCTIEDCDYTETEKHTFEGEFKVCACGEKREYQYVCTSKVKDCTCSNENPHTLTMTQLANLKQCVTSGHNPKHYVCTTCDGCLVEVNPCRHQNKENYKAIDSTSHSARCVDCLEEVMENHNRTLGTCTLCGNHNHKDASCDDMGDGTHSITCSYCDEIRYKGHITASNSPISADSTGHTYNCDECKVDYTVVHVYVGGRCAKCGYYETCTHEGSDLKWETTPESHTQICTKCKLYDGSNQILVATTAHNPDESCKTCGYAPASACEHTTVDPSSAKCANCDCFIIGTNVTTTSGIANTTTKLQNVLTNTYTNLKTGTKTVILTSDVSSAVAITVNQDVIIDLNDHTLSYSKNWTINSNVSVELKGSDKEKSIMKFAANSIYITLKDGANLTLNNVTVTKTGSGNGPLMGAKGTNIKIINSIVDVSSSTNNKGIVYLGATGIENVTIEITNSEIKCGNTTYPVYFFQQTQPYMSSNSVAVTNTTVNGVKPETTDDVEEYIYIPEGEIDYGLPNITVQ